MYILEKTAYGFRITIAGKVSLVEALSVLEQSRRELSACPKPFGVLVDIRGLHPLADDVQQVIDETQRAFRSSGLARSAVVLASAVLAMQFMRIAKDTAVFAQERYVDASRHEDWEHRASAWIEQGIEPGERPFTRSRPT